MKPIARTLVLALLALAAFPAALAGGPIFIFDPENRVPYAW